MIEYLDKTIKPLVLIMPEDKNSKLMSFWIYDEKLLEKCKAISIKIEDLENNELNALLVYDNRSIKMKIRTCDNIFYANFRGLTLKRLGGVKLTPTPPPLWFFENCIF